jgi:hypothetical protein
VDKSPTPLITEELEHYVLPTLVVTPQLPVMDAFNTETTPTIARLAQEIKYQTFQRTHVPSELTAKLVNSIMLVTNAHHAMLDKPGMLLPTVAKPPSPLQQDQLANASSNTTKPLTHV